MCFCSVVKLLGKWESAPALVLNPEERDSHHTPPPNTHTAHSLSHTHMCTYAHTLSHIITLTILTHSHTHTSPPNTHNSHSHTHSQFIHSHHHTYTLSHMLTHTLTHVLPTHIFTHAHHTHRCSLTHSPSHSFSYTPAHPHSLTAHVYTHTAIARGSRRVITPLPRAAVACCLCKRPQGLTQPAVGRVSSFL